MGGRRDDRGGVELFVLVVVLALILALGIVVDLGGRMRVADQAAWTAQQAARVAATQVSGVQIQDGSTPVIAAESAVAAAQQVIAAAGMTGTVVVTADTVTVTVTTTYSPMILGPSEWAISETATAQVVRGITAPR
ncbi:MAG: hypothetical protein FWE61_06865 [Micrococcales bacterium]|nr:hypothetical protein [Micrococcales bacterium]